MNVGAKLTCFISDSLQLVLTMHGEGKQSSLFFLTRHNQLSNSWTKTLNLFSKIVNEKVASSN